MEGLHQRLYQLSGQELMGRVEGCFLARLGLTKPSPLQPGLIWGAEALQREKQGRVPASAPEVLLPGSIPAAARDHSRAGHSRSPQGSRCSQPSPQAGQQRLLRDSRRTLRAARLLLYGGPGLGAEEHGDNSQDSGPLRKAGPES